MENTDRNTGGDIPPESLERYIEDLLERWEEKVWREVWNRILIPNLGDADVEDSMERVWRSSLRARLDRRAAEVASAAAGEIRARFLDGG